MTRSHTLLSIQLNLSWIPINKFHCHFLSSDYKTIIQRFKFAFQIGDSLTHFQPLTSSWLEKLENSMIDEWRKKKKIVDSRGKRPSKLFLLTAKKRVWKEESFSAQPRNTNWPERFVNDPRDTKYTIALANATY